jgi:hypothetical protein
MVKLPDKERELRINYDDIMKDMTEVQGQVNRINGVMEGVNMAVDVAMHNTKSNELKKKLQEFSVSKSNETKEAAIQLNNKLNMLYDRKAYYQGALDFNQYFKVNWGG